jgi:hypothetical protein
MKMKAFQAWLREHGATEATAYKYATVVAKAVTAAGSTDAEKLAEVAQKLPTSSRLVFLSAWRRFAEFAETLGVNVGGRSDPPAK